EDAVMLALRKDPASRYGSGSEFAARLTSVHQQLRDQWERIDRRERFDVLRQLSFFHEFSQAEIHELLRACEWHEYGGGEEIVREGTLDDRFYVVVSGRVAVESVGREIGHLDAGDCFGEAAHVS